MHLSHCCRPARRPTPCGAAEADAPLAGLGPCLPALRAARAAARGARAGGAGALRGGEAAALVASVAAARAAARPHRRRGGRAARSRLPRSVAEAAEVAGGPRPAGSGACLHGSTLQALLKIRCDLLGAQYAIFWGREEGKLVVEGDYATREFESACAGSSFAQESEAFIFGTSDDYCISDTYSSGAPVLVADVASSSIRRKDLALKYGITQICLMSFEGGVLECGSTGKPWKSFPDCPELPVVAVRRAFESICAAYVMLWKKEGTSFKAVSDYVPEIRKASIQRSFGDETFCSKSREYDVDAEGDGPIATCFRTGRELELDENGTGQMERLTLVREYGIRRLYFVPVDGGVVEFGLPFNVQMSSETLEAALKMQCELSGAGYSLYWTLTAPSGYEPWVEKAVVAGAYVSPARSAVLKAQGRTSSFSEESKAFMLDASTPGPTFAALQTRRPVYLQDAVACEAFERRALGAEYNVGSIAFEPVPGGVLEYGTTTGPCTADWLSEEDARGALVPPGVLQEAFVSGATHAIFWLPRGGRFVAGASYVIPERVRALKQVRNDDKSYTSESLAVEIPVGGESPVARAATSGAVIQLKSPSSERGFERAELAREFNIVSCHFVACQGGVLEYGTGHAD